MKAVVSQIEDTKKEAHQKKKEMKQIEEEATALREMVANLTEGKVALTTKVSLLLYFTHMSSFCCYWYWKCNTVLIHSI